MFDSLWNRLIDLIYQVGYLGLFIASFVENLIPPVPSEVIMPLGGYLAGVWKLNIFLVIAVCALGSTLGNIPYYRIGRYLDQKTIRRFVERFGKYFFTKPEYVDDLYEVFIKNDRKIVFFGRFLPGARAFIGLPAGSTRMNFIQFFWYTLAGTLVWTVFLVVLGYRLGERRESIIGYLKKYEHIMLPLIALGLISFVWWIIRRRNKKNNQKVVKQSTNEEVIMDKH